MAIELLTPFTKVELEPEIKDKKRKQVGILGGNFNPRSQCPPDRGGPSTSAVGIGSSTAYA